MEIAKILVGSTAGTAQDRKRIPSGKAAGLTVSVVFIDPIWDNLTKTVIFRGTGSKTAEFDGKTAEIPWEVLEKPDTRIYFGICGTDEKKGLQLPLIEVPIGTTERATNPDADPGTDPTLPIWAQLKEDVEELQQAGKAPDPDWNAAEGEPGHIKNRTHWIERAYTNILPEETKPVDDAIGAAMFVAPLAVGKTYRVKWSGEYYICTAYDYSGTVVLGGEGYPFTLDCVDGSIDAYPNDGSVTVTLAIDEVTEIVHKIPEKFLPDSHGGADLTGYATEAWVREGFQPKGSYLTKVPDGYATEQWVRDGYQPKGEYLTRVPDGYATQEDVELAISNYVDDIMVRSVNGVTPDEDGNVTLELPESSGDSPAIIDVTELPTEDIREDVFYRLLSGVIMGGKYRIDTFTVHCVEVLPETGLPATDIDQTEGNVYYNVSEGECYGYVNDMLSVALGIPAGWYTAATLLAGLGFEYGGVVTDFNAIPDDNIIRVLLTYTLYSYKTAWEGMKGIGQPGTGYESVELHQNAKASGEYSLGIGYGHAEGDYSIASGEALAAGDYSFAGGGADTFTGKDAFGAFAYGDGAAAESQKQFVHGSYNIPDADGKYAHIIGNGHHLNEQSNAHTLDWQGNAWYQGNVYVGGTGQDDPKAVRLATMEDLKNSGGNADQETITKTGVVVNIDTVEGTGIKVEADTTEAVTLVHSGKNLIGFPESVHDTTKADIHITRNEDGSLTLNGTASATTYIDFAYDSKPVYLPAGVYAFSCNINIAGITARVQSNNGNFAIHSTTNKRAFEFTEGTECWGQIQINKGVVCDNLKVWLQLEQGIAAGIGNNPEQYTEYEPCTREEISTTLPVNVEAFEGANIFYTTGGDKLTVSIRKTVSGIDTEKVNALIAEAMKFNYAAYGLPVLHLSGDTSAMTKDVSVDLAYVYGDRSGTASVKWQGSSSLNWPKKNYTVKFDTAFEAVEGWGEQKKYCMKANFIDFSHSRNVCGAKLWGEIVRSRTTTNEKLSACPNYGAIDGFPICIVINDEFMGVYTFNIPKDGWMANMGSGANEAILCADSNGDVCLFKGGDAVVGPDGSDFELEYVSDENNAGWVQTSLNNLIRACADSDGTDLDTTIAGMLDWDSAIDYYIFSALTNNYDGISKNYLLFTYDGTKFVFSAYDLDSIFGGHPNGNMWWNAKDGMTLTHLKGRHRVFELIFNHKKDALKARYAQLRNSVLSEDNVQYVVRNFATNIPRQMLEEDNRKWPTIPGTNISNTQQILDWYRLRVARIDKEIETM